jgi:RNA polymerase primary sigma factor
VVDDSGRWAESYVHQASLAPHLSRDEALLLARRMHRGDTEAKADLITANRRLVVSIARRYVGVPPSEDDWKTRTAAQPPDLEQLAPILAKGEQGLQTAVGRFDESKGFAFPTYATWWIRQAIAEGTQGGDPGGVREPTSPTPGSPSGAVRIDLPNTAN